MRYARIAGRLFNQPHLVKPSYGRTIAYVLRHRLEVDVEDGEMEMKSRDARGPVIDDDGIMTIPVVGGLYHRGDEIDADSGSQSYTNLNNILVCGLQNEHVRGILLDIDSPGGEAGGCFSFADSIKAARKVKPIWAVANSSAASAAYAIGSAAEKFYAARDAEVGSIGVCWLHMDYSKALSEAGIVATYLYAGEHKVDGNPFEPMAPDVRAEIQTLIDQRYQQFVSLVVGNRPMTEEAVRATQARVYLAEQAHELGLIDGVMSFEQVRQEMARAVAPPRTVVRVIEGNIVKWTSS